nr:PIN domain-containing protein [Thiorhodovibrio winogradskyi]
MVLRLLVQEPKPLYQCASIFLEERCAAGASVLVSDLVLAEAYFALQSFYRMSKQDALRTLAAFIATPGIQVTPGAKTALQLPNLASANPGFVDRLIHGEAHAQGRRLISFEKAARKLDQVIVLKPSSGSRHHLGLASS